MDHGPSEILDVLNTGIIVVGSDRRIVQWNAWLVSATGRTLAEVQGRSLGQVFPGDRVEALIKAVDAAITSGASTLLTNNLHPNLMKLRTRAGRDLLHDVIVSPVGAAAPRRCLIQITDVTMGVRRERFLRERQNARYDALLASASDVIMTLDSEGIIRLANLSATRQFGYTEAELIGKDVSILFESQGAWRAAWQEVSSGKAFARPVELVVRRKNGSHRYFEVSASRWLDGSRAFITTILRDINERREAEAALRASEEQSRSRARALADLNQTLQESSEALNAVDRRKDEFLATLAHELRNPLAPLRNGMQILKLAKGNPAVVEQSRTMMERQLAQMVRLIDDLLDLSRINQDKIVLNKERVSLDRIIYQAVEASRPLIDSQRHELTINVPDRQIQLDADVARLTQVLSNLLNNAAKYTQEGGTIVVDATQEGDIAVIRVRDNGIGIPPEMLSKIFELFMQVGHSLERVHGGLGIGLSLVKRLVEMHDGTVEAHSKGAETGSEFVVKLPVAIEASPEPAAKDRSDLTPPRRRRILLADDNQDSAASLATILSIMGHDVKTAHDGLEALAMAEQFHPELVLLDIGMPRLNGYDTARRLRQRPWAAALVVVALTGWGQESDRQRSKEAGFDYHLVKPVETSQIADLLSRMERR